MLVNLSGPKDGLGEAVLVDSVRIVLGLPAEPTLALVDDTRLSDETPIDRQKIC